MRFPVFARKANPCIDLPILRKSSNYVQEQVARGLADWVDDADHRKGIICREMLYFGERTLPVETLELKGLPPVELPGIHFEEPLSAKIGRLTSNVARLRFLELEPYQDVV